MAWLKSKGKPLRKAFEMAADHMRYHKQGRFFKEYVAVSINICPWQGPISVSKNVVPKTHKKNWTRPTYPSGNWLMGGTIK